MATNDAIQEAVNLSAGGLGHRPKGVSVMNMRCQAPGCGDAVMFPEDKIASWGNVGEMAQITGFGFVFSEEETLWFCPECRQQLVDLGVAAKKILGCGDVSVDSLVGPTWWNRGIQWSSKGVRS